MPSGSWAASRHRFLPNPPSETIDLRVQVAPFVADKYTGLFAGDWGRAFKELRFGTVSGKFGADVEAEIILYHSLAEFYVVSKGLWTRCLGLIC